LKRQARGVETRLDGIPSQLELPGISALFQGKGRNNFKPNPILIGEGVKKRQLTPSGSSEVLCRQLAGAFLKAGAPAGNTEQAANLFPPRSITAHPFAEFRSIELAPAQAAQPGENLLATTGEFP
jgi:hypothetical protein